MRFCPFCAQEVPDDVRECVHCGKRLLAPRAASPRSSPTPLPPPTRRPLPARPQPRARPLGAAPGEDDVGTARTLAPTPTPPPLAAAALRARATATAPAPATSAPPAAAATPATPATEEETRETTSPPVHMPRARTGTLLGIPARELAGTRLPSLRTEARAPAGDDGPTMVQAPPGVAADEDPTAVQAPPGIDDRTDVRRMPAMRMIEAAHERARSRAVESAPNEPAPLPPPPLSAIPARPNEAPDTAPLDTASPSPAGQPPGHATAPDLAALAAAAAPLGPSSGVVTNDVGSFPQLDLPATSPLPNLPPMPAAPGPSIVAAVRYLPPLGRAIWARRRAEAQIRSQLHADQRQLDAALQELGRTAREEKIEAPALADELRAVADQEARRQQASDGVAAAEAEVAQADERWRGDQAERQADIERRGQEIQATDAELRGKAEERRRHDGERARLDADIRAAEKRAAQSDTRAQKAESAPADKGGGAAAASAARADATQARQDATALIPARDQAGSSASALDGPIDALTQQLVEQRAALQQTRKELAAAEAAHKQQLGVLEEARQRAVAERDAAERELTQRFVTMGTLLNLNRVEHPRLVPLFARVDELKDGVNLREATIARLESERRGYDRQAAQRGGLVLGIAAGIVVLATIVLVVLLAR